jgi:hypothetical protein
LLRIRSGPFSNVLGRGPAARIYCLSLFSVAA